MTAFAYRAVHTKQGRIQKGTMVAANENELTFFLQELGLELIEAKAKQQNPSFSLHTKRGVTLQDRALLCGQLSDLLSSGVTFAPALDLVTSAQANDALRDRLVMIAKDVKAGSRIAKAFAKHPELFDSVFLSLLDAGERSGDLAATFTRLAQHLKWQATMRRDVARALRYPLFLLLIACGVTSFMMLLVVPEIISFLTNIGRDLPLSTRFLIGTAEAFEKMWWIAPPVLLLLFLGVKIVRRINAEAAIILDSLVLKLPIVGDVIAKLALARMTSSFTILLKSGLSVPQSLHLAASTLGNAAIERQAAFAHQKLMDGLPFSKAAHILFPPMMIQILHIAEKSATLPKALDEIARSCDREAHDSVEAFLGLLEPTLTILIGGLLAWIVLAVLGPIYGSLSPLAGGM